MDVKQISADEFANYDRTPKFNIRDIYWPIYCFYEEHDQRSLYKILVDSGVSITKYVRAEYAAVYQLYGIDFAINHSFLNKRNYVHYVNLSELFDTESFAAAFEQRFFDYDKEEISLIFIRYDVDISTVSIEQRQQISQCIKELLPSATIANEDFVQHVSVQSEESSEYERTCSLDDIISWQELTGNIQQFSKIDAMLTPMLRVLEKVRTTRNVDCIDASKSRLCEVLNNGTRRSLAYVSLMKYGKAIYFDKETENLVRSFSTVTQKQDAMYIDDYIRFLTHLPEIAVVMLSSVPLLVLPDKNHFSGAGVEMQAIYCEIDPITFELIGESNHIRFNSDDIEMCSAASMFNLASTDVEIALAGMHKLKDLMLKFINHSRRFSAFKSALPNISNTIFYKNEGKTYIGYVTFIDCKKPFIAYPLRSKSKPFELQLDLSKQALIDIKIYSDWKKVIEPFLRSNYVHIENAFIKPTRYIDGLLLQGIDFNANGDHSAHGLTIEQIGMYSDSCWSLRKSDKMLQYLKYDCVLNKIATPYGGMHTSDVTRCFINREDWRSDADKIQQFNTY